MEIYLSPEFIKEETQVINVVDNNQKAVGYLALILNDKKMYVYGQLETEGVGEDFKDLVKPYIQGIGKSKEDLEVYSYITIGGESINLEEEKKEDK